MPNIPNRPADYEVFYFAGDPPDHEVDTDGDGLSDHAEKFFRSNPYDADTDNDGLIDGEEVVSHRAFRTLYSWKVTDPHNPDSDGDGLSDGDEVHLTHTDPAMFDSDGDGLSDADEWSRGTNPVNRDTDHDQLSDGQEVNEVGSDPLKADTDRDGLSDFEELSAGSSPIMVDTDGDGLSDLAEVRTYGTNPALRDSDGDGWSDRQETEGLYRDEALEGPRAATPMPLSPLEGPTAATGSGGPPPQVLVDLAELPPGAEAGAAPAFAPQDHPAAPITFAASVDQPDLLDEPAVSDESPYELEALSEPSVEDAFDDGELDAMAGLDVG